MHATSTWVLICAGLGTLAVCGFLLRPPAVTLAVDPTAQEPVTVAPLPANAWRSGATQSTRTPHRAAVSEEGREPSAVEILIDPAVATLRDGAASTNGRALHGNELSSNVARDSIDPPPQSAAFTAGTQVGFVSPNASADGPVVADATGAVGPGSTLPRQRTFRFIPNSRDSTALAPESSPQVSVAENSDSKGTFENVPESASLPQASPPQPFSGSELPPSETTTSSSESSPAEIASSALPPAEKPQLTAESELASENAARTEDTPEEGPAYLPAHRFVSVLNIGWSAADPANRNIGRRLPRSSWATFVRLTVKPQIERGIRRIQLHNPFGALAGEVMQLDQFLHAQDAGLRFITEGFVEAWQPVTEAGVEVIGYVGCGKLDPDFDVFLESGDFGAWQSRAMASLKPLIDAGMSIGLDASASTAETSQTFALAESLRAQGVRVYVEAKPDRFNPHWFSYDVIALDRAWLTADIENGHPQAKNYGISNDLLTGESLRMVFPRKGEEWADLQGEAYIARLEEILSDGQSVVGSVGDLSRAGRQVIFVDPRAPENASFD